MLLGLWALALRRHDAFATPGATERAHGRISPRQRSELIAAASIFLLWSMQYFAYMTWLPQYLVEVMGLDNMGATAAYALPVAVLLGFNIVTGVPAGRRRAARSPAPRRAALPGRRLVADPLLPEHRRRHGPAGALWHRRRHHADLPLRLAGRDHGARRRAHRLRLHHDGPQYRRVPGADPAGGGHQALRRLERGLAAVRQHDPGGDGRGRGARADAADEPKRAGDRRLRHQPVAAGLGHQDLGLGRIALDLLAQAVDMGLQRMGGDAGVVAPDLAQQRVAPDHPRARAVEIFQDRRFLLGQADLLLAGLIEQHLGRGPEGVGPDGEDGILALLMLAQLGAQPRQQHAHAEGLGDVVIGAGIEAEDGIGIGIGGGQHDDGGRDPGAAQQAADLAAVHVGQADIEEHGVETLLARRRRGRPCRYRPRGSRRIPPGAAARPATGAAPCRRPRAGDAGSSPDGPSQQRSLNRLAVHPGQRRLGAPSGLEMHAQGEITPPARRAQAAVPAAFCRAPPSLRAAGRPLAAFEYP